MRKYKKAIKDVLSDVVCDVCGSSCKPSFCEDASMAEFATLEASWGYFSGRDGETLSMDMCERCFERILAFAKSISSDSKLD